MCGISLILDRSADGTLLSRLSAMHAAIPHRGPDGQGFLVADPAGAFARATTAMQLPAIAHPVAGFAFRRLKIRDLSDDAAQPMVGDGGDIALLFNGEIYNFMQLRRELEAKGHRFRSTGDTEVVLAAYREWSTDCFARLDGMWAIAVLDMRRRRLVLSRDRFGIKPIVWTRAANGALLFASEVKQLLAALPEARRPNGAMIEQFLHGRRYPFVDETFLADVNFVPPATWCAIELDVAGEPRFEPYWALAEFTARDCRISYNEAKERVDDVLMRAVSSHAQSDVKTGALLSGGLDSSLIVADARRSGITLPTYSLGYREAAPEFCEMRFVDAMTKRDGIENHETTIDSAWVIANTDRVLTALEEPPLAMPAFAQFATFELCARHGTTVILDGQGADEIAAGYQYHQRLFLKDQIKAGRFGAALTESGAMARRDGQSSAALLAEFFLAPRFRRAQTYDWILPQPPRSNAAAYSAAAQDFGSDISSVNRQLYFDMRWGNAKIILGYGDRSAMAHAIEARVPYFDREFVELLFRLPAEFKIGGGDRKRILRDIARRFVPAEITERGDRMGFGTPDAAMISGPLSAVIVEAITDPGFCAAGWINAQAAERFLLDFREGRHHDYRAVWRLFVLSRWARIFLGGGTG